MKKLILILLFLTACMPERDVVVVQTETTFLEDLYNEALENDDICTRVSLVQYHNFNKNKAIRADQVSFSYDKPIQIGNVLMDDQEKRRFKQLSFEACSFGNRNTTPNAYSLILAIESEGWEDGFDSRLIDVSVEYQPLIMWLESLQPPRPF